MLARAEAACCCSSSIGVCPMPAFVNCTGAATPVMPIRISDAGFSSSVPSGNRHCVIFLTRPPSRNTL